MTQKNRKKIPVNIIAGPLGVGKTTAINHLLRSRPDGERWAILLNEFGLVGLDAALLEAPTEPGQPQGVEIREVAGGCICCSAEIMFDMSLVLLLQHRPDRLLIEPTGLAAVSGILDTLDRKGICDAVDVRSVICMLDPGRLDQDTGREEVKDQVEAADVLLANRSDLATVEEQEKFQTFARSWFPAKRHVDVIEAGRINPAWLDLVAHRDTPAHRAGYQHSTDHDHHHHHDHGHANDPVDLVSLDQGVAAQDIVQRVHQSSVASTIGWICRKDLVFDSDRIIKWLEKLAHLPGSRRVKAVLRTPDGWWGFNVINGVREVRPSSYRRDSRMEVVVEGGEIPDPTALEQELRACFSAFPGEECAV